MANHRTVNTMEDNSSAHTIPTLTTSRHHHLLRRMLSVLLGSKTSNKGETKATNNSVEMATVLLVTTSIKMDLLNASSKADTISSKADTIRIANSKDTINRDITRISNKGTINNRATTSSRVVDRTARTQVHDRVSLNSRGTTSKATIAQLRLGPHSNSSQDRESMPVS